MPEPDDSDSEETVRESVAPPARRAPGGARTPANDPVTFIGQDGEIGGWMLNQSAGGLRVILEERVDVGARFEVRSGEDAEARPARVVWVREAKGGVVVGVAFDDVEHGMPPEDTFS